tara:strand:- start:1517 stop:2716 length:1200 start_codon:yes stop_codon:yes gene_type:complete
MNPNIKKSLFIEITNSYTNFLVVDLDEELNLKEKFSLKKKSSYFQNSKIHDFKTCKKFLIDALVEIESKTDSSFNEVNLSIDLENYECLNVSGFKKLSGSQISKSDISFILNSIKNIIFETETQKSIIHIFNSKFFLDNEKCENLPIGLHGNFYHHHLSIFLVNKNNIKNFRKLFGECNLNLNRVITKSFADGVKVIQKENKETFFKIDLFDEQIKLSFFNESSLVYYEKFNYGLRFISKDLSKVCSLNDKSVKKILSNINFDRDNFLNDILNKDFFIGENFRKISLSHLKKIIEARIEEIIDLSFNKNINIYEFKKNNSHIFLNIENKDIQNNLGKTFISKIYSNSQIEILNKAQDEQSDTSLHHAAEIIVKGWDKEALPLIQPKKSIISRFFSSLFN